MTLEEKYLVSRLFDGRLLWLRDDGPFVWYDSSKRWVDANGVTIGDSMESTPLTEDEIKDLIFKGIIP